MKTTETLKQEVIDNARRLAAAGARLEMILMFLREKGFDKIDSINTIRALCGKSTAESKEVVDHSETWSDRFRSDMEFRENAWRALRQIAASQDPSLPKITIEEFRSDEPRG